MPVTSCVSITVPDYYILWVSQYVTTTSCVSVTVHDYYFLWKCHSTWLLLPVSVTVHDYYFLCKCHSTCHYVIESSNMCSKEEWEKVVLKSCHLAVNMRNLYSSVTLDKEVKKVVFSLLGWTCLELHLNWATTVHIRYLCLVGEKLEGGILQSYILADNEALVLKANIKYADKDTKQGQGHSFLL